jgi:hypothetical protein
MTFALHLKGRPNLSNLLTAFVRANGNRPEIAPSKVPHSGAGIKEPYRLPGGTDSLDRRLSKGYDATAAYPFSDSVTKPLTALSGRFSPAAAA